MKTMKTIALIALVAIFTNCSKNNEANVSTADKPANIILKPIVSADNSGTVAFTVTADNAVSYEFDFGNGVFQNSTTGNVTYKYPVAGTYTVKVTAKSQSGKITVKSMQVTVSAAEVLVWSDEFEVAGAPDPGKWGYDLGNNNGWGNGELEYYTNRTDNAVVSNGTLKINAKKETYNGFGYTSARLLTKGKFNFKYGRLEVKAKLPATAGTWPAIWALGSDVDTNPWPGCGEIDIMEQTGNDKTKVLGTFHYPGRSGGNADGSNTTVSTATSAFHVYAVQWDAAAIKISVDGIVYKTLTNSSSVPFNHNFFMILNVAMGGSLGGTIDPNFTSSTMEIDYVRYYQ